MSLFKIESIKTDKSFFKNSVIDNLKLLAILQFVVGVYTFPIWIEILLVPVLALISAMLAIAENEKISPSQKPSKILSSNIRSYPDSLHVIHVND
jgi:hypothetical protein